MSDFKLVFSLQSLHGAHDIAAKTYWFVLLRLLLLAVQVQTRRSSAFGRVTMVESGRIKALDGSGKGAS
jgi:hypothetical protein